MRKVMPAGHAARGRSWHTLCGTLRVATLLLLVVSACIVFLVWSSTVPTPTTPTGDVGEWSDGTSRASSPAATTEAPRTVLPSPAPTASAAPTSSPQPSVAAPRPTEADELDAWRRMVLPEDWMECIRRSLQLDERGRPLHAVLEMENAIPLLVTPLTGDVKFFPYFVCSVDVPVRYHMIVQNERDADTKAVIDELERRFGESGRLVVVRNRYNRAYSGSMNQGFEWALQERTAAEVPWVFACGVDVIFESGLLASLVRVVAENTRGDAAMLAALREEVEMEERLVREGNYSYYERWAPRGRPLKVLRSGFPGVPLNVRTAPLMPDRIRSLVADENREDGIVSPAELRTRFFGNYTATVTPVLDALGTIAVTRLALSTMGFFDENYFPAYMDDIDLRWRHYAYGFHNLAAEPNHHVRRWHHFNAANMRGSPLADPAFGRYGTEDNSSRRAFLGYMSRTHGVYDRLKYGPRDRGGVWRQTAEKAKYVHMQFNVSKFPMDTWVLDETARQCMFRHTYNYTTQQWSRPRECSHSVRTLEESGVLGTDQLESYRATVVRGGFTH